MPARFSSFTKTLATAALMGLPLMAGDFDPLMAVYRTTHPGPRTLAVVCHYSHSREAVAELARSMAGGTLQVVDVHNPSQIGQAAAFLTLIKPEALVLLPKDLVVRDGSFEATLLVRRLALHDVPTMATSALALKQGAWFAIGDATHGDLLVNPAIKGDVRVVLPGDVSTQAGLGGATIDVLTVP